MTKSSALDKEGEIQKSMEIVKSAIASSSEPEETRCAVLSLLETIRSETRTETMAAPDTESVYFGGTNREGIPELADKAEAVIQAIIEGLK